MEILASIIIIFATTMHTLIPGDQTPDVLSESITLADEASDTNLDSTVVDTNVTDRRADIQDARSDVLEARSAALEEARARRQVALDEARANRDEARVRFQDARDDFKEKLAEIRDAQKQRIVERIADQLEQINVRWTNHFDNVLSRLSEILAKIGTRADKLEEAGKDVASVRDAIFDAQAVIDNAQDAVNSQAVNSYIIEISDEEGLRDDVKAVRDQLHDDLTATRDVVKGARQAVHDAFQALKDVRSSVDTDGGEDGE